MAPYSYNAVIDACVVTYNSAPTIDRLLGSLVTDPTVSRVRVLDNYSGDETEAIVRRRAHDGGCIELTVAGRNLGFPAGCNRLLRHCTSEFALLVNPDVELRPGVLARLVSALYRDKRIGAVTCQLRTRDGRPQSEPARPTPTLRRLVAANAPARVRRLRRHLPTSDQGGLDQIKDVGAAMGALLLFRREILKEVGFLDESVFMYLEDLDLSARLVRAGYRVRYHGDVWAWHDSGVSTAPTSDALYALMPRVWLTYFHRYGTPCSGGSCARCSPESALVLWRQRPCGAPRPGNTARRSARH
jgi:N-acetylglucosaminyl-diphospho-decaprenol L-rhamnosyltransferase